jgi:TonB family protein
MNIRLVLVFIVVVFFASFTAIAQDTSSSLDAPTVLSDTQGYDFSSYMRELTNRVRYNWYALIPDVAVRGEKGKVVVIFTIIRNGKVQDLRLVASSNVQPLDRAATGAIQVSDPFSPLPSDFKGERIILQLTFLYNIKSEKQ